MAQIILPRIFTKFQTNFSQIWTCNNQTTLVSAVLECKCVSVVCKHTCVYELAYARVFVCVFPAVLSTPDAVTHFRNESVMYLLVGEEAAWESQQHLDNAVSGVHCLATSPPTSTTVTSIPNAEWPGIMVPCADGHRDWYK